MKSVVKKLVVALLTVALLVGSTSSIAEAKMKMICVDGRYKCTFKGERWWMDVETKYDYANADSFEETYISIYSTDDKEHWNDNVPIRPIKITNNTKQVTSGYYYTTGLKLEFTKKNVKIREKRRNGIPFLTKKKLNVTMKKVETWNS